MFLNTVRALVWQIGAQKSLINPKTEVYLFDKDFVFVLNQIENMPDYLKFPFKCITIFFGVHCFLWMGKPFYKLSPAQKNRVVLRWKYSKLGFMAVFIKFYESLVTISVLQ